MENLCETCAMNDERYKGHCPMPLDERNHGFACSHYQRARPRSPQPAIGKFVGLNRLIAFVREDDLNVGIKIRDNQGQYTMAEVCSSPQEIKEALMKVCPEIFEDKKPSPKKKEPRAWTKEEVQEKFLNHLRAIAKYWANEACQTAQERCDGVAFSILSLIDGSILGLPAIDLALCPHESDEAFCRSNGENWFEDGMIINDDVALHEMWHQKKKD